MTAEATSRRFYVDTSAYLCVLLGEAGHEPLVEELTGAELLSSTLLVLEATRNLFRLAREGVLSSAELSDAIERVEGDVAGFALRDVTIDLCLDRTLPPLSTPRSLDLAHLRTALWFHARRPLTRFVSLDGRQTAAARELGLPI